MALRTPNNPPNNPPNKAENGCLEDRYNKRYHLHAAVITFVNGHDATLFQLTASQRGREGCGKRTAIGASSSCTPTHARALCFCPFLCCRSSRRHPWARVLAANSGGNGGKGPPAGSCVGATWCQETTQNKHLFVLASHFSFCNNQVVFQELLRRTEKGCNAKGQYLGK